MNIIIKAAKYAAVAHQGQVRKYTNLPYIMHPCRVAGNLAIHPVATDELMAIAYLHDVIEDCDVSYQELWIAFNTYIADGVQLLTNPSKGLQLPRHERKRIDRDHISQLPHELKIIKLLDRIDNLREIDRNSQFFSAYSEESLLLAIVLQEADVNLYNELRSLCQ